MYMGLYTGIFAGAAVVVPLPSKYEHHHHRQSAEVHPHVHCVAMLFGRERCAASQAMTFVFRTAAECERDGSTQRAHVSPRRKSTDDVWTWSNREADGTWQM